FPPLDDRGWGRSLARVGVGGPGVVGVIHRVGVAPERPAGRLVETVDALLRPASFLRTQLAVGDEDAALRHHRAGITGADRGPPPDGQPLGRKPLQNAL